MNEMAWLLSVVAALGACLFSLPARADATTQSSCELHVWPSTGLRSVYHGWFHGGIVDGAVSGRTGYPPVPRDPIDTAAQHAVLAGLDLPTLTGLRGHATVLHSTGLDSKTIRATAGRINPNAALCYAELVIDDLFFQQDVVNGGKLRALIRFRDFGSAAMPIRSFGTWTQTDLKVFPPKSPEFNEAAVNELRKAFAANVTQFGTYLNRPSKLRK